MRIREHPRYGLIIQVKGVLALIGLASALHCHPVLAVEPGQRAPDFDLPAQVGRLRLSDLAGRWVYLDFWASWCGPCKQSFPWMNEMHSRYGGSGLRIVAIDVDQRIEDGKRFLAKVNPDFDVAFDSTGATPAAYGVKSMPTSLLISPDGRVTMIHAGFRMEDRQTLERQIRRALQIKE